MQLIHDLLSLMSESNWLEIKSMSDLRVNVDTFEINKRCETIKVLGSLYLSLIPVFIIQSHKL